MAGRKIASHSEEWWEMVAPPTAVRCEGHTQDGHRCRREAHPGAVVCRQHGGAAGQVRAKAAARIGNAADEMVKRLHAMLDDPEVEAREKVKIAQDMLDRAGLNATSKLIVGVGEIDPVEALFRDILSDPNGLADPSAPPVAPSPEMLALNKAADLQAREDEGDIVDAEVVEETPQPPLPAERMSDLAWRQYTPHKVPPHIRRAMEALL